MTSYQYTQQWFAQAEQVWPQLIPLLPANPTCLEIGSFEGRSMVWIAENMLGESGHLTCIDTWEGSEEHTTLDMKAVEQRFDHNRRTVMEKLGWDVDNHYGPKSIGVLKGTSFHHLMDLHQQDEANTFDFIYVDGSHTAKDVLTDAVLAWPLLKQRGILVFDDYAWGEPRDILHRPKLAIDAFVNIFAEEVELIHVAYQAIVRKR